jgi:IclR family pca regulon transcriptional regulator
MPRDQGEAVLHSSLRAIKTFGGGRRSQTLAEVAGRIGLPQAATRDILLRLCRAGVVRSDGGRFLLRPNVLELGHAFVSGMTELGVVNQVLVDLTRQTGEAAAAVMLDDTDIVCVACSLSARPLISAEVGVGVRRPAHATSTGQVLLAQLSPDELERYFVTGARYVLTEETLTAKQDLLDRLEEVRRNGFALVSKELDPRLTTIAVAIPKSAISDGLAINILIPAAVATPGAVLGMFLPALQEAVRKITVAIAPPETPARDLAPD